MEVEGQSWEEAGHGHKAVVTQSKEANMLLARRPAELAPSAEPECKWQSWQEEGSLCFSPFHPSLVYPFIHSVCE